MWYTEATRPEGKIEMRIYKKFIDAIAIIMVFMALIQMIKGYKDFVPYADEGSKFVQYIKDETVRPYVSLALSFLAAGVCGAAFSRLPAIGLAASFFPMWYGIKLHYLHLVTKKPLLYIMAAAIVLTGNVIATVLYFRRRQIE